MGRTIDLLAIVEKHPQILEGNLVIKAGSQSLIQANWLGQILVYELKKIAKVG
jgi:hypothetical protein